MSKQAISVTLAAENLLWRKGRVHASGARSLSAVLDEIVSTARSGGHGQASAIRSVVGTVHISGSDPALRGADAAIRALFPSSGVAEPAARYSRSRKRKAGQPQRRPAQR